MGLLHELIWNTYKSEGGGGSSDFSTAEVTNAGLIPFVCEVAIASEDNQSEPYVLFLPNATQTVILYKGRAKLEFTSGTPEGITTSGDIMYDADEGYYIITGNCTITITE